MKPTELSLEAATAVPPKRRYTHQEVMEALPNQWPDWLGSIKEQYDGNWSELLDSIVANIPHDNEGNASLRTSLGFTLVRAGRREGASIIIEGLKSKHAPSRLVALKHIQRFWSGALGVEGKPGELPLNIEVVVAALGVAFQDIDSDETRYALRHWALYWPAEQLNLLAQLRSDRDARVFIPVIKRFLVVDCDDGTLDVIASHLLEPGIQNAKNFVGDHSQSPVQMLCEFLSLWTAPSKNEAHRQRAARIAAQVLNEALQSQNAAERLADPHAATVWFVPKFLLDAASQNNSDQTTDLLARVAAAGQIDPRTRARALIHHKTMTGNTLAERQTVIDDLFLLDTGYQQPGEYLKQLVELDLVTIDEILRGVAQPNWAWGVTQAIASWPRSDESDAAFVKGLSAALDQLSGNYRTHWKALGYIAGRLKVLPRTLVDDVAIRQSLQIALTGSQGSPDGEVLVQKAMELLVMFGGSPALDLESMDPWVAMLEHWRLQSINWEHAAQLLVDAGAMDPDASCLTPLSSIETQTRSEMVNQTMALLHDGGRSTYWIGIRNNSVEMGLDQLFSEVAALVRPALQLDAVVQLGSMRFDPVPVEAQRLELVKLGLPVYTTEGTLLKVVVYFQGRGYEFFAAPWGTWLDVWSVLHAFDLFMAQIGRPERIFWLTPEDERDDWAFLVCALPDKFRLACEMLRLPVKKT